MVKKRSEQEWRELINNFESYGYQNPTVFCVAHNVHVRDLKQKQMELKTNRFIRVPSVGMCELMVSVTLTTPQPTSLASPYMSEDPPVAHIVWIVS